jgi:hypothetical protein
MKLGGGKVNVSIAGTQLEQVSEFVYLGFRVTEEAECSKEIRNRLELGSAVISKLTVLWKSKGISAATKCRLVRALIWPVATYGCEAWTLRREEEKRIEAFEMKCYRRMLRIPWTAKKSNLQVLQEARTSTELLSAVKKRKLQYFGHVARQKDSLEKDILMGMTNGQRKRGRPRTSWMSNIQSWTGMSVVEAYRKAQDRKTWKNVIFTTAQHRSDEQSDQ